MAGMQMAMMGGGGDIGAVVTLGNASIFDAKDMPTSSTASFSLNNTKTVTATGTSIVDWLDLIGVVGDYETRATLLSGTLSTGTTGSWLNLATSRAWTTFKGGGSAGFAVASITLEIRRASTLAVLATATINLSAEVA